MHDLCRDLQRINNSLRRWDHSGFLPNWLPFFLHACSRRIYYPFALVPKYNFNAFGPFAFLSARVNMHGFAWFFLKEQFIFLNGGDPDILHAWFDAYIALRFNSARLVAQFFHFLRNFTFNLYIAWCNRSLALRGRCHHTNCKSPTHWRINCPNYFEVGLNSVHALQLFPRRGGGSVRIRRGAACLYRLNSQLGKLYNYHPARISAAQKDIIRIFLNIFIHLLEGEL